MKPAIVLVGGFLGAGKTTLILAAARLLAGRGVRCAVVLNDQAGELVDTRFVQAQGVAADQVSGGCFCCRFPDLIEALDRVAADGVEVIFAEAVGSCTDLVATTLRPLLRDYPHRFRVAPLTVIAHPGAPFADEGLAFLDGNQRAEADIVVTRESVDAVSGKGVGEWVDEVLGEAVAAGTRVLQLDYARYAEAEASLAWLNARIVADVSPALSPAMLVGPLLDRLAESVSGIVHLKLFTQCDTGYLKAAITGPGGEVVVDGALDASPARRHEILINVRALGCPAELRRIVETEVAGLRARVRWCRLEAFRPAAPVRRAD